MGQMKQTMDFLNSFMPETVYAGFILFALAFYWKYKNDEKKSEKLDSEQK